MSLNILVVDDDRFAREKVKSILRSQGFQAFATDDWAEITRIVAAERVDVILMDVEMPHLSGDRIASILLKRLETPPKIFLHSTLDPAALAKKAKEVGAHGYIPKGLRPVEYAAKIENALAEGTPPAARAGREPGE